MSAASVVLFTASFFIFVVAFGIPYWTRVDQTNRFSSGGYVIHSGLWLSCVQRNGNTQCTTFKYEIEPDWLKAVQAMEILAFLFSVVGLALTCISTFIKKSNTTLRKASAVLSFIVALFILIGVIIFGVKMPGDGKYLHAGFGLAVVASAGFGLTSVLLFSIKQDYSSIP